MRVWAPAALHQAGAQRITLHSGEDRLGVDIHVDLAGLHLVAGSALAPDHHVVSRMAVHLIDPADSSFRRDATMEPDGSFRFLYVPAGSYQLVVVDAADRTVSYPQEGSRVEVIERTYHPVEVPVEVGLTDVVLPPITLQAEKAARPLLPEGVEGPGPP